jgi:outer membrane protein OmpA-like peptidoglycan-associated protein
VAATYQPIERIQKRWIFLALGLAVVLHVSVAGALHLYRIHEVEIPSNHSIPTGPFTVKRIEINPDALNRNENNPISKLPVPEPPQNPAEFNLDSNLVEKALQAPLPKLSAPAVPDPGRVIAATDLSENLPFTESDSAKITADIAKVTPSESGGPMISSKLAQEVIDAGPGFPQPGIAPGTLGPGNGAAGQLPGFASLAPSFRAGAPTVSNLPDPVLLRLPSDVLFDFDSAVLKPEADPLLSQAVGLITKYPSAAVQIDGYSDSFGKADYNLSLSQQRAQAVEAWIRARVGQAGYQFQSQGHGSADYVVPPPASIEQQQPNRRVEILIQALKL